MRWPWRRRAGNGSRWEREIAAQREEDASLHHEVERQLDALSDDDPVAGTVRHVFRLFERWYFTFAKRDATRLGFINANLRRLILGVFVAFILLAAGLATVGVITIRLTVDQGHDRTRQIQAIQTSRYDAAYDSCRAVNGRNRAAIAYLQHVFDMQIAAAGGKHAPANVRAQTKQGLREFDTLVNALVPRRADCAMYAHHQTHPPAESRNSR